MKQKKNEKKLTIKEREKRSPFEKGRKVFNLIMLTEFQRICKSKKIKIVESRLKEDVSQPNYLIIQVKNEKILVSTARGNLTKTDFKYINEEYAFFRKQGKMPYMYIEKSFSRMMILVAGKVNKVLPSDSFNCSQIKTKYGSKVIYSVVGVYLFKYIYNTDDMVEMVNEIETTLEIN